MDRAVEEVMSAIEIACREYKARYNPQEIPLELEVDRDNIQQVAQHIKEHPELGKIYGDAYLRCDVITTIDVVVKDSQQAVKLAQACCNGYPMRKVEDIRLPLPLEEYS